MDDPWEPKNKKGPSEPQVEGSRGTKRETAGGVDVIGNTRAELMERAKGSTSGDAPR